MRAALALAFLALLPAALRAQGVICPGLIGDVLLGCLRAGYTPTRTYGYDRARDTLFAYVDDGDRARVTDIYAGRVVAIPAGWDPTIAACNGDGDGSASSCSGPLNVNTEHAYPQSKGAGSGPARADLHHLFPARADANSSRGDLPYGPYGSFVERDATRYFLGTATLVCPAGCPPADPDAWSATSTVRDLFRPRAVVRGDLARAVFYFYAVYRAQADAADPGFFGAQREALLAWHRADPPDDGDRARSARVAAHQGNENPFALDPTLVERAYFAPALAAEDEGAPALALALVVFGSGSAAPRVVAVGGVASGAEVAVYDVLGRAVGVADPATGAVPAGLGPGVYVARVTTGADAGVRAFVVGR